MTDPRGSLGDRLRMVATLAPASDEWLAAMIRMLAPADAPSDRTGRSAAGRGAAPPAPKGEPPAPARNRGQPDEPDSVRRPAPKDAPTPLSAPARITILPRESPIHLDADDKPNPLLAPAVPAPQRVAAAVTPAGQARATFGPLAAMPGPAATIDLDALLAAIGSGQPLTRLPRRIEWSLRRGAQLLIDRGPALMPLGDDVDAIERQLLSVVGPAKLGIQYFLDCPERGTRTRFERHPTPWRPPPPGTPTIVLGDLGCAGPHGDFDSATPHEWLGFAARAQQAGVALVALLPYPIQRVSTLLAGALTVVPWSERLTAAAVQRILRDSRSRR